MSPRHNAITHEVLLLECMKSALLVVNPNCVVIAYGIVKSQYYQCTTLMILSTVSVVDISEVQSTTTSQHATSTPNPSSSPTSPPPLLPSPPNTVNPANGKSTLT
jgi:hypothetical protein